MTLRLDKSRPAFGSNEPQEWAVAVLDNGAEVRMRALGDRVEVRTWDPDEDCKAPGLDVRRVGAHVIDARVVPRAAEPPTEPRRIAIDFGDLLVAVAHDLDDIRTCVGCGNPSTWAGLYVDDQAVISATAWCDNPTCEHDRTVLSADSVLALPIDHLPGLRRPL